jgi:hypothetical protein
MDGEKNSIIVHITCALAKEGKLLTFWVANLFCTGRNLATSCAACERERSYLPKTKIGLRKLL